MTADDEQNGPEGTEEEESFAELLERSGAAAPAARLEPGAQIEARILQVGPEWIFLDVGQKSEGILDRRELEDEEGNLAAAEGETVRVFFLSREGGELRFTTRLGGAGTGTAQLEEAWRSGIPVAGTVASEIKGGLEVRLPGGTRAFCPHSQSGLRRTENPEQLMGQSLEFRITQFGEKGRNIVVSRRALLEEERARQKEALRQSLKEGDVVPGIVTSVREFGAFVDIGGIEGLLPVSEAAWGRVEDLSELLHPGQELEVAVKSLDWEAGRFTFSLRETQADPWQRADRDFPEGKVLTGRVVRLAPFGAFVSLADGVEGLVHISRLGEGRHLRHPSEVLSLGQELQVRVEKVEADRRRISLAPAAGEAAQEAPASYREPSASMGTLGDLLRARKDSGKKKR